MKAVQLVLDALRRWASEYTACWKRGLRGRWCDRYPNAGKQSGAFSRRQLRRRSVHPDELQADVLDDVFTLAHEAGHSMHTYSARRQPFQYYSYTIFVAEVASTFNEQLLSQHMLERADDRQSGRT
jgi:oligoendopeptidase F